MGLMYRCASGSVTLRNTERVLFDASGGPLVATLPARAFAGHTVQIKSGYACSAVNTVTVARNGKTIMGAAQDLVLEAPVELTLVYDGLTWRY